MFFGILTPASFLLKASVAIAVTTAAASSGDGGGGDGRSSQSTIGYANLWMERTKQDCKWTFGIKHFTVESGGRRAECVATTYMSVVNSIRFWNFISSFLPSQKLSACISSVWLLANVCSHIPFIWLFLFIIVLYKEASDKKKPAKFFLWFFYYIFSFFSLSPFLLLLLLPLLLLLLCALSLRRVLFGDCEKCYVFLLHIAF